MCKKSPYDCKAKVKCQRCSYDVKQSFIHLVDKSCKEKPDSNLQLQGISKKFLIDKEQEDDKLTLNEVDSKFEQQYYVIETKGE